MTKVLVVDDSALVRKLFGRILADQSDFEVAFARNGVEALAQLGQFEPDVITLDIHMPEMDGLACLNRIMVERPCPVLMVSSSTEEGADITLEALRLGAVDFVAKPEGAVSLHMEVFGPHFVSKVRAAANAKLKSSLRLRERIQHRIGKFTLPRAASVAGRQQPRSERASGEGLVVVGTSTGGPPALEALVVPLAASFPWPIVIAQHMPASFTGALAKRLDKLCNIRVVELASSMILEPGHAYIARGDADMVVDVQGRSLIGVSVPSDPQYTWHPSVERLARSVSAVVPASQIVGVLMTGMGDDGAAAMAAIKRDGGRTIAEAEETAIVWGMPGSLVKSEGADWVLPVKSIADKLQELVPSHAADSKRA